MANHNVAVSKPQSSVSVLPLEHPAIYKFHKNGFLRLEKLVDASELHEMKVTLEFLFENRIGSNEGARADLAPTEAKSSGKSLQLNNPVDFAPGLHRTKCFQNALSLARQLLGEDVHCLWDLAILKKAKRGSATLWHQDEASRDPHFEYNEMTVWIPMQDTDAKSSCLQFIPGSHLKGVLAHEPSAASSRALRCTAQFDVRAAVACDLRAGGCTIHHPRTLHYAGPNSSSHSRLAYILIFGSAPKPCSVPRTFPWLQQMNPDALRQRREWMWRGGLFVTAWRKVCRGELKDWHSVAYGLRRSLEVLRSGR
jgi:Phytanoyl-CoA dioxygenase (PhyH)